MKYKKVCYVLCVLLALQPQIIMAEDSEVYGADLSASTESEKDGKDSNPSKGHNAEQEMQEKEELERSNEDLEGKESDAVQGEGASDREGTEQTENAENPENEFQEEEKSEEQEDISKPDLSKPEVLAPEFSGSDIPQTEISEDGAPETSASDLDSCGTLLPDPCIPDSDIRESRASETDIAAEAEGKRKESENGNAARGKVVPQNAKAQERDHYEEPRPQAATQNVEEKALPLDVKIENVLPLSANAGVVEPKIVISNLPGGGGDVKLELESRSRGFLNEDFTAEYVDGKLCLSFPELSEDDQYVLRIKNAGEGNKLEQTVVFSVNQKGTTFAYDKDKLYVDVTDNFTPVIRLENVDTTEIVSCMVNGRETPYCLKEDCITIEQNYLREGKNQITLAVQDMAGNVSVMEPWEFVVRNDTDCAIPAKSAESVGIWRKVLQFFREILPLVLSSNNFFTD